MVVCMVVRVRNDTSRRFTITQADDPFYTAKVDGQACGDQPLEIAPGVDVPAEGLVVPWAATTRRGLAVGEVDQPEQIRCVVGPSDFDDSGTDWLRLHSAAWEPLLQERWLPLGRRHLLGAVGGVVELQLTFREPRGASGAPLTAPVPGDTGFSDELRPGCSVRLHGLAVSIELNGAEATCVQWDEREQRWTVELANKELRAVKRENVRRLQGDYTTSASSGGVAHRIAECAYFEKESASAPGNTVFLNVYDLAPAASIPNSMLCNSLVKTMGAFHAAVEVYGEEWGFYRQASPDDCGICRSRRPRQHPVHVYRQSVNLGKTELKDWEVWNLIRWEVIPNWPSKRYDLIHSNCIHFADEMLWLLGVDAVPAWVKGLHENAAAILKVPWPLSLMYGSGESSAASDSGANPLEGAAGSADGGEAGTSLRRAFSAVAEVPEDARDAGATPRPGPRFPQPGAAGSDEDADSFASFDEDPLAA